MDKSGAATAELTQWLGTRQSALRITKTTQTPGGQTLDWVPIESQSGGAVATPPPAAARTSAIVTAKQTSAPIRFDIGEPGPAGHVPILRPDVSLFRDGAVLREVLSKRGGLRVNIHRPPKTIADPNPAGYFHATSAQWATVYGGEARLNVWDPKIDVPSSPGDDHSISQTWLQNYQTGQIQSIEAGWTVDRALNGDLNPHLFTFFTNNSYGPVGDNMGGYNRWYKGWQQYDSTIYPGIIISPVSVVGGAQVELGIKFQLFQGNWWLGVNSSDTSPWTWVGYYPASLFPGGLADHAEWISFGGEVYSALPNPCNTADQMGSGLQAASGTRRAAYQRDLRNQTDTGGTLVNFNGATEVDAAASNCAVDPYTIDAFMESGTTWGSYQYFGGPTATFLRIPTEGIWQWVDYGTMVDDGVHPWNPDFRYLLTGIVLADLAKYATPALQKEMLGLAARQIRVAADGIAGEMEGFSERL
jgi:hypothetical protein